VVAPTHGWDALVQTPTEFKLSSDEYLTGIDGRYSASTINALQFFTSKGNRSSMMGRAMGSSFSWRAPTNRAILYLAGFSDSVLRQLEVFAAPLPPPQYEIRNVTYSAEWDKPTPAKRSVHGMAGINVTNKPELVREHAVWEEEDFWQINLNSTSFDINQYSMPSPVIERFTPPNELTVVSQDWMSKDIVNDEHLTQSRWGSRTYQATIPPMTVFKCSVYPYQVVFVLSSWNGTLIRREWNGSTQSVLATGTILGQFGTLQLSVEVTTKPYLNH